MNQKTLPSGLLALATTIFLLATLLAPKAQALPVSVGMTIGKPLVFTDLNTNERKSLGANMSFSGDMGVFIPDYPFSAGVYYEAFFFTDFGSIPISNGGLQFSYYPFCKPIETGNESGNTRISNLGMSIYGTFGTGLTFMNMRDQSEAASAIFGATAFNMRLSTTLEYPLSESIAAGGTILYQTTFGAESTDADPVRVGFTGFSLLARLVFTIN